jgi:hypothetical protein
MKKNIIFRFNLILLVSIVVSVLLQTAAQGLEDYNISFDLTSIKQEDNSRLLKLEFSGTNVKNKKDVVAVVDAEVSFYNKLEDQELLLGKSKTNKEGIISFIVPKSQKYLKDSDGYITVVARFEGNKYFDPQESELMFKDLFLEIALNSEDSIRTITVNAYTLKNDGTKEDVESLDIAIGVKGMLSKLVLDENTLEGGQYEYELPDDIHGNSMGELTLFVNVDENADFGSVISTTKVKDTFAMNKIKPEKNKLWTDAAPIWMYVVLTLLLVGVWSNYLFSIFNIIKIYRLGKS